MARMLLFGGEGVQVSQTIVRSTKRDRQGGLAAAVVVAAMALGAVPTLASSMSALANAASTSEAAVARPAAPDIATVGPDGVQVTWNDRALARHPDAMPVAHLVYRQSEDGTITQPAGGTCVGNVIGAGCVDTDVPTGRWHYYTRAVLFDGLGGVSPMSADVTVEIP